jgi:hypothetical protein
MMRTADRFYQPKLTESRTQQIQNRRFSIGAPGPAAISTSIDKSADLQRRRKNEPSSNVTKTHLQFAKQDSPWEFRRIEGHKDATGSDSTHESGIGQSGHHRRAE